MNDTELGHVWEFEGCNIGVYTPGEYTSVELTEKDLEEMLKAIREAKEGTKDAP